MSNSKKPITVIEIFSFLHINNLVNVGISTITQKLITAYLAIRIQHYTFYYNKIRTLTCNYAEMKIITYSYICILKIVRSK